MATKEDCIEALLEAAERLGESPTRKQYEELGMTPSASTILRHCGGWNDAKEQAGLATNEAKGGPKIQPKPDHVDLPDHLEWEELSQDQRWHYRNREWNAKRSRERKMRIKSWVGQQKQARGCKDCDETDPVCLDFHHRPDEKKWLPVSMMVTFGYGVEKLREEIEKCDVLCANCHRREHYRAEETNYRLSVSLDESSIQLHHSDHEEQPLSKPEQQRLWTRAYKRNQTCAECGKSDPACLVFHHLNSEAKRRQVSQLISDGCTDEDLLTEIGKCEVLCANCHRRKHYEAPEYLDEVYVEDGVVRCE